LKYENLINFKIVGIKINEDTKKMADLLRSGNRMLNMACPVCNNPLFRKRSGETFCSICEKKIVIVKNKTDQESKTLKENIEGFKIQEEINISSYKETLTLLKNVIFEKIKWITQELKTETQVHLIKTYSEILSKFIIILNNFPF